MNRGGEGHKADTTGRQGGEGRKRVTRAPSLAEQEGGVRTPFYVDRTHHLAGSRLLGGDGVTRPITAWRFLVRESERGFS